MEQDHVTDQVTRSRHMIEREYMKWTGFRGMCLKDTHKRRGESPQDFDAPWNYVV